MAARDDSFRPWTRTDGVLAFLSLSGSVAPVVLMFAEWLTAWAILGRRPVKWVDDPAMISPTMNILGFFTAIALLHLPAILLWFPGYWMVRHGKTRLGKVLALATLVLPVSSIAILRADPWGITSWWFD